ncbi:ATPase [Mucilaginibacter sp. PPCGB 2223]|uniref:SRPBCC family protein n=1 Tax=Mucilaginibacter sp. PPCGB 2223 TaxID=1886027 RepID=UPI000826DD70|nr:SRPBCC domain-containing protein [Mucilaginibacter sp. PPCGB 2223]OCX51195.1 ATPase [Mucilaginibacter sp. PPCGB 2223]
MNEQNFTMTFLVDQSPKEVFDAVTNVAGWWSETVEGGTHNLNDEFSYRHGDLHYSKHKLIEVVPNKRVVWLTTDSELTFVENKTEWTGTTIIFDIAEKDGKTELTFVHQGLVPQFECYKACFGGWTYYLQESLLPLITTGNGNPDKKQDASLLEWG